MLHSNCVEKSKHLGAELCARVRSAENAASVVGCLVESCRVLSTLSFFFLASFWFFISFRWSFFVFFVILIIWLQSSLANFFFFKKTADMEPAHQNAIRPCLVPLRKCGTFVYICQLLSNHKLNRLKRFV